MYDLKNHKMTFVWPKIKKPDNNEIHKNKLRIKHEKYFTTKQFANIRKYLQTNSQIFYNETIRKYLQTNSQIFYNETIRKYLQTNSQIFTN